MEAKEGQNNCILFSEFVNLEKVKPPIIKIIYSKFSNDILKIKHLKRPPNLNFLYLHVTIKLLIEFCLWKLHKSWEFLQDTEKGIKKCWYSEKKRVRVFQLLPRNAPNQ